MEREVRVPSTGATGIIIETERLRMRAHRDGDLGELVALAGNWEIARWTGTISHPYSEIDGREWIARVQENHATGQARRFAIALKETDRLIGGVGLDGDTGDGGDEPALGYWLGQPCWGNGYAGEAAAAVIDYGFRTLGLKTIRAIPTQAIQRRKGSSALRPEKRWRDQAAHADPSRRAVGAVIPHLAAGALSTIQAWCRYRLRDTSL
jgi:RimJ/RimL family protein N-acetyltransferase